MALYECPHCGELIEENASFCRHCGSDEETGWNPDADYLSLELPEEDDDEPDPEPHPLAPSSQRHRNWKLAGPAMVMGAWVLYVTYGASQLKNPIWIILPAIILLTTILTVAWLAKRQGGSRR